MFPILRIFDFDETISQKHTAKNPESYSPENNTKEGIKDYLRHNNEEFCAIATFHKDPHYVLSYLLSLLELDDTAVIGQEAKTSEHHQLMKFYLKDFQYPIIIATPLVNDYNSHLRALAAKSKTPLLSSIVEELPPCYEYHYYEDGQMFYEGASELKIFNRHLVVKGGIEFKIAEEQPLSSIYLLKMMLETYLAQSQAEFLRANPLEKHAGEEKEKEEEPIKSVYKGLKEKSFFASSSSSPLITEESIAKTLIDFLDSEQTSIELELKTIHPASKLNEVIQAWEMKTKEHLPTLIEQLLARNSKNDGYVSGDDYEDLTDKLGGYSAGS